MINIFNKLLLTLLIISTGCDFNPKTNNSEDVNISYNLITPGSGIYAITDKNIRPNKIEGKNYEKVYRDENGIIKIERYNQRGELSDNFSVPAITLFEYDNENNVKYIKYYSSNGNPAENETFGYWSVEYIYDELNRVRMEIYRDSNSKFLTVPRDEMGNIADLDFIAPFISYEYLRNDIRIKAFDQNFNLLKAKIGEKPCIPFIDCGDE